MAEVNTSGYPTAAPPGNLLGMVGQYATAQNALNQNALFQQTFKARQALGPLAQQSIGADGQMDYNKFSVLISAHPDTAWMAPDIINGIVQRQLTQSDTVLKNLEIAKTKAGSLGDLSGALVSSGKDGLSFRDHTGAPVSEAVDQRDILGMAAQLVGLHKLEPGDAIGWAARIGTGPDGKFDPKKAYKDLLQFAQQQQGAAKTLEGTFKSYSDKFGGGTRVGTESVYSGKQTPMVGPGVQPGGVVPDTAGPGVKSINPTTGAQTQSLVGQPLPPTGAAPGIESIVGGGAVVGAGGPATQPAAAGGPAGPQATSALGPVQAERLKAMGPFTKETNDQGTKSLQMNQILDEMDKARSQFKTGGGMDGFVAVAKALQAAGVKDSVVDKIAGGNLGAAQEYSKLQAQLAAAVLKNALMPGAGRILQSEYQTFTKANANWDTDPRAIDKMFSFMRTQNGINIQRMNLLNGVSQAANRGEPLPKGMTDLSDFEPWFNKKLIEHKVISGPTQKLLSGEK